MTTSTGPTGFRRLVADAGPLYFPVSLLARLPMSMLSMAALTYVVAHSEDFTTPGTVAAIAGVGTAMGAPIAGTVSDRIGQRITLLALAFFQILALIGLLYFGASHGEPVTLTPALMAISFFAGAAVPPSGPMTRVRWINRYAGSPGNPRALETAQSYESTMDETSFVLGPAAVGVLASFFGPAIPLYVSIALCLTVVPAFGMHHTAKLTSSAEYTGMVDVRQPARPAPKRPFPTMLVAVLATGMLGVGTIFGSLITITTVFADATGHPGTGGLIFAVMGITSGLAALSVARWPQSFTASARWLVSAISLVPLAILLWLPAEPWQLALVILLMGVPVGPILVTNFSSGANATPPRRMGFVMTMLSASITLGTSVGNSIAGRLADSGGYPLAMVVTVVATGVVLACALLHAGLRKRQSW